MNRLFKFIILGLISINLMACFPANDVYAPVIEVNTAEPLPKNGIHKVLPSETLYAIAWRYGFDYRDIARWNAISPPYHIKTGQLIYLTQKKSVKKIKKNGQVAKRLIHKVNKLPKKHPIKYIRPLKTSSPPKKMTPVPQRIKVTEREPQGKIGHWQWPAHGAIVGTFSAFNKGINIGGHLGDSIFAVANGKVVYSGHGLRGYGNLIIIKHNSTFLTAYAHNHKLFVKEGDWVRSGQKIAEMGDTGTQRVMLHFEIRRNGKPVNPLIYLDKKS